MIKKNKKKREVRNKVAWKKSGFVKEWKKRKVKTCKKGNKRRNIEQAENEKIKDKINMK